MTSSVFDDGPGRAPGFGWLPAGAEVDDCSAGEPDRELDDLEVVDEFGRPVLPPDHTEQELAAILATCPLDDPVFAAGFAAWDVGPDGLPGRMVPAVERRLEDLDRLDPGVALVSTLQDLTGLEPPFGTGAGLTPFGAGADGAFVDDDAADGVVARALGALAGEELRRVIAGWERVASWVRAAQARVAAELMTRTDGPLGRDSVAGEVAAELRVTTPEAWQIATRGEGVARYPQLGEALAAGRIDAKKADTFLTAAGTSLTPDERGEAINDLLPRARMRTWKWISEQMNARAATLHGKKARRQEQLNRCNVWAEQAGPGMGRLIADLPVADAARTFNTVQAAAKALKDTPGETRPLGALRAAAFTALVTGDLVLPAPDDTFDDGNNGNGESQPPRLVEPMLDTDLIPVPDDPHGIVLTAPAPAGAAVSDATRIRVVEVTATVNVTVPARTLLDPADTTPGILDGIGPIPAHDAARIAADGTWRRLLTDPKTGILTDYSTRTYTPGSVLRAAVTARDQSCRFPGCHRPATAGGKSMLDLDHIQPFDKDRHYQPGEPGQTRADNLQPLCRKHHNVKTHGNWSVTRDPDTGTTRWTPPTGIPAVVDPTIVDPVIRYGLTQGMTLATPPRPASATPPTPPPDASPPPF